LQNLETRDTATLTPRFWLQGKRSAIDTARLDSTTHDGAENEERKEKMKKRENLQKSKRGERGRTGGLGVMCDCQGKMERSSNC